jgi:hypothetical protein
VTHAENVRRGNATKLSKEQVAIIKSIPLSNRVTARQFGVGKSIIGTIRTGKWWKGVEPASEEEVAAYMEKHQVATPRRVPANTKMNSVNVAEIRATLGEISNKDWAYYLGVGEHNVYAIRRNLCWKNIEPCEELLA